MNQYQSIIQKVSEWSRPNFPDSTDLEKKVVAMLEKINRQGDSAIDQFSLQFDHFKPTILTLQPFEDYQLNAELKRSIQEAAHRIEHFAKFQKEAFSSKSFSDDCGEFSQRVTPIDRVGCYIPGGRFPLISTALMTLIPANVAGCNQRIAVSPSDHPALLAAASLAKATQFIHVGGVQAIGALAYGSRFNEPVELVVGPGNAYVNQAKRIIQSTTKIDGLAGPSELLALCDDSQPVEWLALDAMAQSEHDPMAQSVIISDNLIWLEQFETFVQQQNQFKKLITNKQIILLFADTIQQMIDASNTYAPEHLMLCHNSIATRDLKNFGSLFVGVNSAVAIGDYCAGPNHTLPTCGYAKQSGGLSVHTFLRVQTIQKLSNQGRIKLSQIAMPLAQTEGLTFHYESLKVRSSNLT